MTNIALIYIAGPLTDTDGWKMTDNIHRAERLARVVFDLGAFPVVPHSWNRPFPFGVGTSDFWYDATMEVLCRCDGALFTEDWDRSRGARAEMDYVRNVAKWHAEERADQAHLRSLHDFLKRGGFRRCAFPLSAADTRAHDFLDLCGGPDR